MNQQDRQENKGKNGRKYGAVAAKSGASAVVSDMVDTPRQQGRGKIPSDILGSYTGTPEKGETPEQDPDDL